MADWVFPYASSVEQLVTGAGGSPFMVPCSPTKHIPFPPSRSFFILQNLILLNLTHPLHDCIAVQIICLHFLFPVIIGNIQATMHVISVFFLFIYFFHFPLSEQQQPSVCTCHSNILNTHAFRLNKSHCQCQIKAFAFPPPYVLRSREKSSTFQVH